MTKTYLWVTFLAVTLMTGLLVGSIPTSNAAVAPPCPPPGKFVEIGGMGPFEIDSYTTTSMSDGGTGTTGTFMFTHEVDSDLSGKIDDALKDGLPLDIHFSVCKAKGQSFKQHTVWLIATITEVTETAGEDDDFPTEKTSGTFTEKTSETTSSSD